MVDSDTRDATNDDEQNEFCREDTGDHVADLHLNLLFSRLETCRHASRRAIYTYARLQ